MAMAVCQCYGGLTPVTKMKDLISEVIVDKVGMRRGGVV